MQNGLFDDLPDGVVILKGFLDRACQEKLVEVSRQIARQAPLVSPQTRSGFNFSLKVTSVGDWGWFSNQREGYHYRRRHPQTNQPWAKIPTDFMRVARRAAEEAGIVRYAPDTCLINHYPKNTGRLGLHQDNTEEDITTGIVTVSLGDSCRFLIGGLQKTAPTQSVILDSGDICIMHREGRMLYHGVDGLISGSSDLLAGGGRISLTFRRNKPLAASSNFLSRSQMEAAAKLRSEG